MAERLTSDALGCPHGFFTRSGGVSSGIYDSLQCGWGAREDSVENVRANRAKAAAALGAAPERLRSVYQVHGPVCRVVDGDEPPWKPGDAPRADALATAAPGLAIAVLTADCAPVLFEDAEAGVVGAAHAGWRGALAGVLESTVAAMTRLGARAERIRAAVGPCIGAASYEVGPEYRAAFLAADPDSAPLFEEKPAGDRLLFDLPGYVALRLGRLNLAGAAALDRCTYSESGLFFSNRRALHHGEPDYGRLISAIMIPSEARPA